MTIDPYCRWLASYFFAPGYDADDLFQEARTAAWLAPGHERTAARRQVLDCVKIGQRRGWVSIHGIADQLATTPDTVDAVDARELLRRCLACPPQERRALGRVIRGEPIRRHEKALQVALHRARERLAA